MSKLLAALPLLLTFGCTTRVILGFEDGGTSGGGSMTDGAASSTGAEVTSGTTGGQNTGTGSTGGTSAGSATGNETHGSTGTTGGDAGLCQAFGSTCVSNTQCCTGTCNGTCRQSPGQACLSDGDCSSDNCANDQCTCGSSDPYVQSSCAVPGDCCNGNACIQVVQQGAEHGICCYDALGVVCLTHFNCCNDNCVNGACTCIPLGDKCPNGIGCCPGLSCSSGTCLAESGQPCDSGADCTTETCENGTCGSCAGPRAMCSAATDCCAGYGCASTLVTPNDMPPFGSVVDAGLVCCGTTGTVCNAGLGLVTGCCGECKNGSCACGNPTDPCFTDQGCCGGGACMTSAIDGGSLLACCQMNSQLCFSKDECCSGNCSGQVCACVQAGGTCGPAGSYAAQGPAACCSGACGDAGTCL